MNEIWNKIDKIDKSFEALRDKYVPDCGMANTKGGEIIRAYDRIVYRYFNDGDMVGISYGNETCNGSYRFLYRTLGDLCPDLVSAADYSEDKYLETLLKLAENVKKYLDEHPDVFETENYTDSRDQIPEDFDWQEEDEDEDWYDEDEDETTYDD